MTSRSISICWADWAPAAALAELSRDFSDKSGIAVEFELVPWTGFAARVLPALAERDGFCDLLIGDSQWIGAGASRGHYVRLNSFLESAGISMSDFLPATVDAYCAWPKGTANYWAVPAMGDALGWVYRKDWFARPELRDEFRKRHGRDLAPPADWTELAQVAEFFQNRRIDGATVHGAAIYTERGSEGITMGVTAALYANGFQYHDPAQPYRMEGFVNAPAAVDALDAYKELYRRGGPPGHSNAYMAENMEAFRSGRVAMQMNFFALFPAILGDPNVGGDRTGFFVNPRWTAEGSTLGGQGISVVAYSEKRDLALEYLKWFAEADTQARWWALGGFSCSRAVLGDPGFAYSAPFAADFLRAMTHARDFWQEPAYADLLAAMQTRVHDFIVRDVGTAKQALDGLIADWTAIFRREGKP